MKKEMRNRIIKWSLYVILLAATIAIFALGKYIFGQGKDIAKDGTVSWTDQDPLFWNSNTGNAFVDYFLEHAIPNTLATIRIVGVAVTFAIVLHYLAKIVFRSQKGKTISRLLVSFAKWAIGLCAVFFILDAWGAPATATEVREIGIRTTKLLDVGGNVKIVNNSEIKTIINQTQELSLAKSSVYVSYNARIEKVEAVISDNIDKIKEKIPAIVKGPIYMGVSELGESGVELLFVAYCKEDDIYQVQRDINREIKIMFDDNDIEIPFNQLVVHMGQDADQPKVTKQDIKKAEKFNEEQKELSQDLSVDK